MRNVRIKDLIILQLTVFTFDKLKNSREEKYFR